MAISVTNQLHVFLLSLIGGALVGVFFDMFRTLRRLVKSGTVFVGVQDMAFWLLFAGAAFFFLYRFNYGQPRWYIFCGILLGALFYHLIFRDGMVRLFMTLWRGLFVLLRFLFRMLCLPLLLLYRIFRPILACFGRIFRKIFRFCKRIFRAAWWRFSFGVKKIKKRRKMY